MSIIYAFFVGLVTGGVLVFIYHKWILYKIEQAKKFIP